MHGKLLIVNSHCPNARYVPMGSFGLCDHLVRQGHQARIFNGSIYPVEEQTRRLEAEVARFQPTVIGLIMQWKEYTESAIRLSRHLKRLFPETPLIAGGMTAGYFADPLLRRYRSIDGVIRGDAEEPLHQVLCGTNWPEIPNLLFRKNGDVVNGRGSYLTDSTTLNRTSFTGLDRMVDHQRYLEAIEPVLGFPVFIGRGCLHRCQYCGGSRKAFVEHSGRKHPVFRSTESVVRDLRQLSRYTRTVYIGFENSARYLKKLFRLVAADPELSGTLTLNYGAWGLPDRELLELYGQAFCTSGPRKPILEISPETAIDDDRRLVRDPALYFSNRQLTGTLETIRELFGNRLRVELYYSRYHHTHESREKLETELCGIHDLHQHLHRRGIKDVVVTNYHLAWPGHPASRSAADALTRPGSPGHGQPLSLCAAISGPPHPGGPRPAGFLARATAQATGELLFHRGPCSGIPLPGALSAIGDRKTAAGRMGRNGDLPRADVPAPRPGPGGGGTAARGASRTAGAGAGPDPAPRRPLCQPCRS